MGGWDFSVMCNFFVRTMQTLENISEKLFVTGFYTNNYCARTSLTHKAWLLINIYARFVVYIERIWWWEGEVFVREIKVNFSVIN
jgi:hypothetical protein